MSVFSAIDLYPVYFFAIQLNFLNLMTFSVNRIKKKYEPNWGKMNFKIFNGFFPQKLEQQSAKKKRPCKKLKFKIGYGMLESNRPCMQCTFPIKVGDLHVGQLIEASDTNLRESYNWCHDKCGIAKFQLNSASEIQGFSKLSVPIQ